MLMLIENESLSTAVFLVVVGKLNFKSGLPTESIMDKGVRLLNSDTLHASQQHHYVLPKYLPTTHEYAKILISAN